MAHCRAFLVITIVFMCKVAFGHVEPCDVSTSTMKVVSKCPTTEIDLRNAVQRKNCDAISNTCLTFEYHCLRNWNSTALVEVCAPSIFFIGGVCGEYNVEAMSVRGTLHLCHNFTPSCPERYKSTEQFKYPGCYILKSTSPNIPSPTGTSPIQISTEPKEKKHDTESYFIGAIVAVAVEMGVIFIVYGIRIIYIKRKKEREGKNVTWKTVISTSCPCSWFKAGDSKTTDRFPEEDCLIQREVPVNGQSGENQSTSYGQTSLATPSGERDIQHIRSNREDGTQQPRFHMKSCAETTTCNGETCVLQIIKEQTGTYQTIANDTQERVCNSCSQQDTFDSQRDANLDIPIERRCTLPTTAIKKHDTQQEISAKKNEIQQPDFNGQSDIQKVLSNGQRNVKQKALDGQNGTQKIYSNVQNTTQQTVFCEKSDQHRRKSIGERDNYPTTVKTQNLLPRSTSTGENNEQKGTFNRQNDTQQITSYDTCGSEHVQPGAYHITSNINGDTILATSYNQNPSPQSDTQQTPSNMKASTHEILCNGQRFTEEIAFNGQSFTQAAPFNRQSDTQKTTSNEQSDIHAQSSVEEIPFDEQTGNKQIITNKQIGTQEIQSSGHNSTQQRTNGQRNAQKTPFNGEIDIIEETIINGSNGTQKPSSKGRTDAHETNGQMCTEETSNVQETHFNEQNETQDAASKEHSNIDDTRYNGQSGTQTISSYEQTSTQEILSNGQSDTHQRTSNGQNVTQESLPHGQTDTQSSTHQAKSNVQNVVQLATPSEQNQNTFHGRIDTQDELPFERNETAQITLIGKQERTNGLSVIQEIAFNGQSDMDETAFNGTSGTQKSPSNGQAYTHEIIVNEQMFTEDGTSNVQNATQKSNLNGQNEMHNAASKEHNDIKDATSDGHIGRQEILSNGQSDTHQRTSNGQNVTQESLPHGQTDTQSSTHQAKSNVQNVVQLANLNVQNGVTTSNGQNRDSNQNTFHGRIDTQDELPFEQNETAQITLIGKLTIPQANSTGKSDIQHEVCSEPSCIVPNSTNLTVNGQGSQTVSDRQNGIRDISYAPRVTQESTSNGPCGKLQTTSYGQNDTKGLFKERCDMQQTSFDEQTNIRQDSMDNHAVSHPQNIDKQMCAHIPRTDKFTFAQESSSGESNLQQGMVWKLNQQKFYEEQTIPSRRPANIELKSLRESKAKRRSLTKPVVSQKVVDGRAVKRKDAAEVDAVRSLHENKDEVKEKLLEIETFLRYLQTEHGCKDREVIETDKQHSKNRSLLQQKMQAMKEENEQLKREHYYKDRELDKQVREILSLRVKLLAMKKDKVERSLTKPVVSQKVVDGRAVKRKDAAEVDAVRSLHENKDEVKEKLLEIETFVRYLQTEHGCKDREVIETDKQHSKKRSLLQQKMQAMKEENEQLRREHYCKDRVHDEQVGEILSLRMKLLAMEKDNIRLNSLEENLSAKRKN